MAYIVPSDILKIPFETEHTGELDTLQYLKNALPNNYTVFHGVHWSREYESWTHFGEIDFVILSQTGRLLFIEQKNGAMEECDGRLIKWYGSTSKDVADQLHRSIDKVREKYQSVHGKGERLDPEYLILCPDYEIKSVNAVGISENRIVDANSRGRLAAIIQEIMPAGPKDEILFHRLKLFFRQSFDLVPNIHAHKNSLDKSFVRQTGTLVNVLANLEMNPFRLRISGTAGSGKSLMVHRFMEKQAMKGKRILFLCFNHLLAEKRKTLWQNQYPDDTSKINTFHGFCREFLDSQGITLDYEHRSNEPGFWTEVLEQVMALDIQQELKFDTLIVDEGQDFDQDWYEIARLFLNENADLLWLEDNHQALQARASVELDKFVTYRSNINYRTPEKIADYIMKTLPVAFEVGNPIPGLGVQIHAYNAANEQPRIAARVVQELVKQGFAHEDIAIISCKGLQSTAFSEVDSVGNLPLKRFTGTYDEQGRQIMMKGKLHFDSMYRFKGLESLAVILVDVDFNAADERQQRILFCAMTRATMRLEILASNDSRDSSYPIIISTIN